MHRTDAPDFDPDIGGGRRGYKEIPIGMETVLAANAGNAFQEEIAQTVEGAGLTLAVSGAADATANWGQLLAAIKILSKKEGIWVDATQFGFVTGSPPAGANKTALDAAFLVSPFVFIPPGIYELDSSLGNVNISAGGILAGSGVVTVIKITSSGPIFNIQNKNVIFRDFKIDGNGLNVQPFRPQHTLENVTSIINILFSNFSTGLLAIAVDTTNTADKIGLIMIEGCTFLNFTGSANAITAPDVGATQSSRLICKDSKFENCQIIFIGITKAIRRFDNNEFFDGLIGLTESFNLMFTDNEMDLDSWNFTNSEGPKFFNNYLPDTLSNTFFLTSAFVNWRDNKDINGRIQTHFQNINGGFTRRQLSGNKAIPATSVYTAIDWDSTLFTRIANDTFYTKDVFYDTGLDEFIVIGLGNGRCRVRCVFNTSATNTKNERAALFLNGVLINHLSQIQLNNNTLVYNFNGEFPVDVGDKFSIQVQNDSGGSDVLSGAADLLAFIEVEGL